MSSENDFIHTEHHPLLTAALTYAARGWPVFSCHTMHGDHCSCGNTTCEHAGKHPRTAHGVKDATTDPAIISDWWQRWPTANIAIATGAVSGLVVLDIDPRNGGDVSLELLESEHGALPETLESLTGGGGRHLLFARPGGIVKNSSGVLGAGLDVKADGGYIIAPPSRHSSGQQYEWEVTHGPDDYELASLPMWLLQRLERPVNNHSTEHIISEPIPEGQRNEVLFKLACAIRTRGCSKQTIFQALHNENTARCQPPLSQHEIQQIANSAYQYQPRATAGNPAPPPPLVSKSIQVILHRPSELVASPITWRIESILPDGMLTVLHSRDKLGKTLFAWEAASAMLKRHPFLGNFATIPGRVVLALLDDPPALTVERRDALALTNCEDLRIITPVDADLSDPLIFLDAFRAACAEFKPQLIVLDALYLFAPSGKDSMNDAARMRGPMGVFNALAEEIQAAVVLIAHDRNDGSDVAGSHVIRANAKALLHLTKPKWTKEEEEDDGRRILTVVSKLTGEARHLLRNQGVGQWTYLGRGDSAHQSRMTWAQDRVLMWLKEGGEGTVQEIAKAARIRKEDTFSALTELVENARVTQELRPRADGKKGKGRLVYRLKPPDSDLGNVSSKERDGNDRSETRNPLPDTAQSNRPIVPFPSNQPGTIGLTKNSTTGAGNNEFRPYCSHNLLSKGEADNDNLSETSDSQRKAEVFVQLNAVTWLRSQLRTPQHIAPLIAEWVGPLDRPTHRSMDALMQARWALKVDAYVGDDDRFWWCLPPHGRQ